MIIGILIIALILVWVIITAVKGQEVIDDLNKKYPNAEKFTFYSIKGPKSFAISHFKKRFPTFDEDRLVLTGGGWKYLMLKEEIDNG